MPRGRWRLPVRLTDDTQEKRLRYLKRLEHPSSGTSIRRFHRRRRERNWAEFDDNPERFWNQKGIATIWSS